MKKRTFKEFKTISYPMAQKQKVWIKGKQHTIPKGKALPDRTPSSAGGDGD